jgi:Radical SAM superfamily/Iron-sulfur cluster-binding domain
MIELNSELKKSYTFDTVFNVSDFFTLPSSTLYKNLLKLKKDEYEDSYRIVFKCFDSPRKDQVQDFLIYLYKALLFLDIPTFFVTIATNNEELIVISPQIAQSTTTDLPISITMFNIAESQYEGKYTAILNPPDSICVMPWISLDVTVDGTYKPCCYYDSGLKQPTGEFYHVDTHSYKDVYYGEASVTLRNQLLNGEKPSGCNRCWINEDSNSESFRTFVKNRTQLKEFVYVANWEQNSLDNLVTSGVAFGNLCNLKCRICGPGASSKIAEEVLSTVDDKKSHPVYETLKNTRWIKQKDHNFWSDLSSTDLNIKFFDIGGGEPLISPQHMYSLKKFIENGRASDISLHYNTNGTVFNMEYVELWKHFKMVEIALSIDDIEDRLEYERHGTGWSQIEKNLDDFINVRSDNIKVELHSSINIQNVYYLPELIEWSKKKNFDYVHFSSVVKPSFLNVSNVTERARALILNKLTKYQPSNEYHQSLILKFVDSLKNANCSDGKEFCKKMKELDTLRNESFSKVFPEVATAMGYDD